MTVACAVRELVAAGVAGAAVLMFVMGAGLAIWVRRET